MSTARWAAALLPLFLLLAACGGPDGEVGADAPVSPTPTDAAEAAFPVTVRAANGDVAIDAPPERIVSLSATATEMLFAIGAGDQVVAVDEHSSFPPEAPTTDLSGFNPNVEAISTYDPDLVVVSDNPDDLIAALAEVGVPVIHHPAAASLDDTYGQIEQLGVATGRVAEAVALVADMESEIDDILADVGQPEGRLSYYHELDSSLFSVTSDTFIGQVYDLLGLENIADAAEGAADSGGYPQLSAEFVVEADPDLIFLADAQIDGAACGDETSDTVAARAGWSEITAVRTGAVYPVDCDVASRWGPRVVDFMRTVAEHIDSLQPAS